MHSQQLAKVIDHTLNFRNRASRRQSFQVRGMRLLTRAQEKTTPKHNESQLPFYCSMIVIQNCPRAAGLVWLWHTPQMAPQLMGNIIWATRFSGHVFPTVATTKHLSPQNVAWQISSTQSHPSFMTVWTSQATKQHRARGHQAHSMSHKTAHEHWTHAHIHHRD